MTHVGDGVDVGSGEAEVTHDLEAAIVSRQVERRPAVLDEKRRRDERCQKEIDYKELDVVRLVLNKIK